MAVRALGLSFLALVCVACSSGGSGGSGGSAGTAGTGGAAGMGGSGGGTGGGSGASGTGGGAGSAGQGGSSGGAGASGNPVVEIETSLGMMAIELLPNEMPITTQNFLSYVNDGFYTGTIFHRVIPDFVIQGGGFEPGLTQKPTKPPITLETNPAVLHDYGVISMARTSDPNSATSQFFIVNSQSGAHSLDGQYAAFGKLIEGSNVLDAISAVPTETVGVYEDVPVDDVVVTSAKVR